MKEVLASADPTRFLAPAPAGRGCDKVDPYLSLARLTLSGTDSFPRTSTSLVNG